MYSYLYYNMNELRLCVYIYICTQVSRYLFSYWFSIKLHEFEYFHLYITYFILKLVRRAYLYKPWYLALLFFRTFHLTVYYYLWVMLRKIFKFSHRRYYCTAVVHSPNEYMAKVSDNDEVQPIRQNVPQDTPTI